MTKAKAMKKILRIILITVSVILILMIAVPLLFRSKIESMVKEQVNQNIHATVDWSGITLSFFRGFPDLSINLRGLSVVGLEPFGGDTLMGLDRFELRVNPFGAFRDHMEVKSVLLDRPKIHGIVLENGTANWDIVPVDSVSAQETGSEDADESGTMTLSLERFVVRDGRIFYRDATMELESDLGLVNAEMTGDFAADLSDFELHMAVQEFDLKQGGIRYLRHGILDLDLVVSADLVQHIYTLRKNEIKLNGLVLGAEGTVGELEDGALEMNLRVFSKETSFKTLLSMVPAIYLQDYPSIEASGNLVLQGEVTGLMKDTIYPDARLTLEVSDGSFSYPELPEEVSDIQIRLNVDYRGADMDATRLELEKFHMLLAGNPIDVQMLVENPFSDMHVAGHARGRIDLTSLHKVMPLEDIRIGGLLESDLRWDTRLSSIEQERYEEVDLEGRFQMENVSLETPELAVPVDVKKMELDFTPRMVELKTLDLVMGSSDLQMDGRLTNLIPYVFSGQVLSGSLNVSSQILDANELMPAETGVGEEETPQGETAGELEAPPPDSLADPLPLKIPEDIDFRMILDLKKLLYGSVELDNVVGKLSVSGGVAHIEQLNMEVIQGKASATGIVDTRGDYPAVDLVMEMTGVDIPSSYESFVSMERLAPMAKYCKGSANVKMKYQSKLDASFNPVYGSINAKGNLYTRGLQVYNLNSFVKLSELLKNEKFRDMAPDEVNVQFTVLDGRVVVAPFKMNFDASRITVSGSHGIDLTMDYLMDMQIAKSDLGSGARELMAGISLLASGAGFQVPQSDFVNVKARITGTFGNPKITTDLSGNLKSTGETVKTIVEEKITQEVEKAEERVREEASVKAEEIIRQAEEEAEALVKEAQRAGDNLVKEAEIQGEKLIKEAGSNPIRQVAAKRAAGELNTQAKKQSESLVKEAESKASAMIEQARAEAARL